MPPDVVFTENVVVDQLYYFSKGFFMNPLYKVTCLKFQTGSFGCVIGGLPLQQGFSLVLCDDISV